MAHLKLLLITIFALQAPAAIGQTAIKLDAGPQSTYVERGQKRTISWNDMIGSLVEVDGLAWGAFEKGLGSHLVLPRGKIYLENSDLVASDLNGRLARVAGVLRKSRVDAAPKYAQGYSQAFEYYYLDVVDISQVAKLEFDQLLPTKNDWIRPGVTAEDAERMIKDRNLNEHLLALRTPARGEITKSYLVSEGIVIVYRILDGRVISVWKIKLNDLAKRIDDEWITLKGFKLQPISEIAR